MKENAISPTTSDGGWLGWADLVTKDTSLRQALGNPQLRSHLCLMQFPTKKHPRDDDIMSLVRRFTNQMRFGCHRGTCDRRFCKSNPLFQTKLERMRRSVVTMMAMELARRARENKDLESQQPHADNELVVGEKEEETKQQHISFLDDYTKHLKRGSAVRIPKQPTRHSSQQQQAVVVSAIKKTGKIAPPVFDMPLDDSGNPPIALSKLDATTAPVAVRIGGRFLENTWRHLLSEPQLLSRCFVSVNSPLDMDIEAAVATIEQAKDVLVQRQYVSLYQKLASIIEHTTIINTCCSFSKMVALLVLVLATIDDGCEKELRVRMAKLAVSIIYPSSVVDPHNNDANRGLLRGWHLRFVQNSRLRQQWLAWWAAVPAKVARSWIALLQADAADTMGQLLGDLVASDRTIARRVAQDPIKWTGSLELLRLISDAKGMEASRQLPGGRIGREEFYGPQILEFFDINQELLRWIDCMRYRATDSTGTNSRADAWTEDNLFSPFLYPFLFSTDDKFQLHVEEAHVRMKQRYLCAHERQAEMTQTQKILNIDMHAEGTVRSGYQPGWPLLVSNRAAVIEAGSPYLVLAVRRERMVLDVMDMIATTAMHGRARFPLKVRFVASGEDGVDMGGVQKELLAQVVPQLLDPDRGLFVFAEDHSSYMWPNAASPHSMATFEVVGALLGIAVANGIQVDAATAPLAPLLVQQLAFQPIRHNDQRPAEALLDLARDTFPGLVSGLQQLLEWQEDNGAVEDVFCRSFEVSFKDPVHVWERLLGESVLNGSEQMLVSPLEHIRQPTSIDSNVVTVPLVDNGSDIPVTASNRQEYVCRYLEFLSFLQTKPQIEALRRGFMRATDGVVYRMLSATEMLAWVSGNPAQDLDVDELERIAGYDDEFTAEHPVVGRFWRVVRSLSVQQRRQLLGFVTASERLPLGGYDNITFVVQRNGPDSDRLPTALTCFGRLLLPAYGTEEKLRDRLVTAIENSSGFGLV